MTEEHYDAAIIGAGVVGLAMACDLGRIGLKVAIFDKSSMAITPIKEGDFDSRVFAINRASTNYLKKLNVWQACEAMRTTPYRKMEVWDGASSGRIEFDSRMVAEKALGHIVEGKVLKNALLEAVTQQSNVDLFPGITLDHIDPDNPHGQNLHAGRDKYSARLLIGADGANSWLRKVLATDCYHKDYHHHALISNVKTQRKHRYTARQVYTQKGPLAFLPLPDSNTCSIVWSIQPEQAKRLMALSQDEFHDQLGHAFEYRLGRIQASSQRFSYPLLMRHVKRYIHPGVAFIGDAAHTIHPMAGQGMNLGLADARYLGQLIETVFDTDCDFYSFSLLRRFERKRKFENWKMIGLMQALHEGFSPKLPLPFSWLRGQGMHLGNRLTPLKSWLIEEAMGI